MLRLFLYIYNSCAIESYNCVDYFNESQQSETQLQ